MIECSECETWIHFSCAKIRKNNVPEVYTCQLGRDSKFTARKSNRVRTENNKFTTQPSAETTFEKCKWSEMCERSMRERERVQDVDNAIFMTTN